MQSIISKGRYPLSIGLTAAMVFAFSASAAISIEADGAKRLDRYQKYTYPISTSGITYGGGENFWAVADDGNDTSRELGLHKFGFFIRDNDDGTYSMFHRVPCNNSQLSSGHRTLANTFDLEACAYDPASGNIWAANEAAKSGVTAANTIREYNPSTGAVVSEVTLPAVFANARGNFGLESLTISGDGLTMWTCNEEALSVDGPRSSASSPTTVRIVKFSRPTTSDAFTLEAVYPYTVPKWVQANGSGCMSGGSSRNGVSDLCALPDGTLLVLERELSNDTFRNRICKADFSSATDIRDFARLDNTTWTPAARTVLKSFSSGGSVNNLLSKTAYNYEGMCLGPREPGGTHLLVLIADAGDGFTSPCLRTERLLGLQSVNLDFNAPPVGKAKYTGHNFRFEKGKSVTVTITDTGSNTLRWKLPNHTPSSGIVSGGAFTFTPTRDDTLSWELVTGPVHGDSDHVWSAGTVTTPADCIHAGVTTYTCSCGATKTAALPAATGIHTYADGHCTVCGASDPSAGADPDDPVKPVYYLIGEDKTGYGTQFASSSSANAYGWSTSADGAVINHTVASGNDYVINQQHVMRASKKTSSQSFAGDRLILDHGNIFPQASTTLTIPELYVQSAGTMYFGASDLTVNLNGKLVVSEDSVFHAKMLFAGTDTASEFKINAELSGEGAVRICDATDGVSAGTQTLTIANAGDFTGSIYSKKYTDYSKRFILKVTGGFGGSIESLPYGTEKVIFNYAGLDPSLGVVVSSETIPDGLTTGLILYGISNTAAEDLPLMTFPAGAEISTDGMTVKYAASATAAGTAFASLGTIVHDDGTITVVANPSSVTPPDEPPVEPPTEPTIDPTAYGAADSAAATYTWKGYTGPWIYTTNWTASTGATYGIPNSSSTSTALFPTAASGFTCTVDSARSVKYLDFQSSGTLKLDNATLTVSGNLGNGTANQYIAVPLPNNASSALTLEFRGAAPALVYTGASSFLTLGYPVSGLATFAGSCNVRYVVPAGNWSAAPLRATDTKARVYLGRNVSLSIDATALGVPASGTTVTVPLMYAPNSQDGIHFSSSNTDILSLADLAAASTITCAEGATGELALQDNNNRLVLVVSPSSVEPPVEPPVSDKKGFERAAAENRPPRVLVIGNSFTQGVSRDVQYKNGQVKETRTHFPTAVRAMEEKIDYCALYRGGSSIQQHYEGRSVDGFFAEVDWSFEDTSAAPAWAPNGEKKGMLWLDEDSTTQNNANSETLQPGSGVARNTTPADWSLEKILNAVDWDVVMIQEASVVAPFLNKPSSEWTGVHATEPFRDYGTGIPRESYGTHLQNYIAYLRNKAPHAELWWHQTWALPPETTKIDLGTVRMRDWMYNAIATNAEYVATNYNVKIMPTGYAVQLYRYQLPVAYPDTANADPCSFDKRHINGGYSIYDTNPIPEEQRYRTYLQMMTWCNCFYGKVPAPGATAYEPTNENGRMVMRSCALQASLMESYYDYGQGEYPEDDPQPTIDPTAYGAADSAAATYTWKGYAGRWDHTTNWTASAGATYGIPNSSSTSTALFPTSASGFICTVDSDRSVKYLDFQSSATLKIDNATLSVAGNLSGSGKYMAVPLPNASAANMTLEFRGAAPALVFTGAGAWITPGIPVAGVSGFTGNCSLRFVVPSANWSQAPMRITQTNSRIYFGERLDLAIDATALGVPASGTTITVPLMYAPNANGDGIHFYTSSSLKTLNDLAAVTTINCASGATGALALQDNNNRLVLVISPSSVEPPDEPPVDPEPPVVTRPVYYMVGSDGSGASSFVKSSSASVGWAATAGGTVISTHTVSADNDYVISGSGVGMRTPATDGALSFAGHSLMLASNGSITVKGNHVPITFSSLIISGGVIAYGDKGKNLTINGPIEIVDGTTFGFTMLRPDGTVDTTSTLSQLAGGGTIRFKASADSAATKVQTLVLPDAASFTGKVNAVSYTTTKKFVLKVTGGFGGTIESLPFGTEKVVFKYTGLDATKGVRVDAAATAVPDGLTSGLVLFDVSDPTAANLPLITFPAGVAVNASAFTVRYAASADAAGTAFTNLGTRENSDGTVTLVANYVPAVTLVAKPTVTASFTYDGATKTAGTSATGYTVSGNAAVNAGSYTFTATLDSGYAWSDGSSDVYTVNWSIGTAQLTVVPHANAASVVYGGSAPGYTLVYTGWQGSDSEALLVSPARPPVPSCDYTVGDDVDDSYSYNWFDSTDSGLPPANYHYDFQIDSDSGFEVVPASVTVKADNKSKTYGNADPALTATVTGLVGSDTVSYSLSRAAGSNVGNYTITASGNATQGNYSVSYQTGTFTIIRANTATEPVVTDRTYSGVAIEGYTSHGAYTTFEGTSGAKNVGNYSFTATPDANHAWSDGSTDPKTYNWKMKPAPLTATAKPKTITYGSAPANDGVNYSGFVNGETSSVLGGTLAYDYSYSQYGNVGNSYTITPKGLTSSNYSISFVAGTLTVQKKGLTVAVSATNRAYDGTTTVALTGGALTGVVNSDAVTAVVPATGSVASADVGNGKAVTVGEVTLSGAKAGNYSLTQPTVTVNITRAGISLPSQSGTLTYNGTVQTVTMSHSTGYTISGNTGTNAGGYTATLTPDANHCWSSDGSTTAKTVSWSIGKCLITEAFDWTGMVNVNYDGAAHDVATTLNSRHKSNHNPVLGTDYEFAVNTSSSIGSASWETSRSATDPVTWYVFVKALGTSQDYVNATENTGALISTTADASRWRIKPMEFKWGVASGSWTDAWTTHPDGVNYPNAYGHNFTDTVACSIDLGGNTVPYLVNNGTISHDMVLRNGSLEINDVLHPAEGKTLTLVDMTMNANGNNKYVTLYANNSTSVYERVTFGESSIYTYYRKGRPGTGTIIRNGATSGFKIAIESVAESSSRNPVLLRIENGSVAGAGHHNVNNADKRYPFNLEFKLGANNLAAPGTPMLNLNGFGLWTSAAGSSSVAIDATAVKTAGVYKLMNVANFYNTVNFAAIEPAYDFDTSRYTAVLEARVNGVATNLSAIDTSGSTQITNFELNLHLREKIAVPTAVTGLVYSGVSQTGVAGGTGYTVTGGSAVDAGSHTATVTPGDNYCWSDGTTDAKEVSWSIAVATIDMSGVVFADKTVTYDGNEQTILATGVPETVLASYQNNTLTDTGSILATVTFVAKDPKNYAAPDPATLTATLTILSAAAADIDGKEYSTIGEACAAAQPGDTVRLAKAPTTEDPVVLKPGVTIDLNGKAEGLSAEVCRKPGDWFDITIENGRAGIELNALATPTVGDGKTSDPFTVGDNDVAITVGNVKPNLYYGVAESDSLDGLSAAVPTTWIQADAEGNLPVLTPVKTDAAVRFYRVIAAALGNVVME